MLSLSRKLVVLALGAAVVMAVAAPAAAESAKKKHRHVKHKVTEQPVHRGTDKFPAGPLYYNGNEYLGDDPDPNIRFQLWRDLGAHFGGESN